MSDLAIFHPPGTEPPRVHASASGFARYAWGVLGFNLLVVLWGALVRATGSGAGCGNHWPLCNGEVTPSFSAIATVIEFTHRVMSGIDLVLVAVLVWWAFRAYPRGSVVRLGAVLSAIFLVTEALIGAALVLFQWVAQNASVARAYSLSGHLINTLTLLACLVLTAWWASGGERPRIAGTKAWICGAALAGMMLLGVSGAIAALGDTLFPVTSLAAGLREDLSSSVNLFVRLRVLHPVIAVLVAAFLLFVVLPMGVRSGGRTRRFGWALAALLVAQLGAGVANVLLLAPVWMQLVHLLLADLVWLCLVLLSSSALAE
ncbi:MAG TPA: COX15/CtaA family protein [Bryobacteraceae bacterium]|nr:COX15/CtaA family protein [Bryobacteraceae bacterium]